MKLSDLLYKDEYKSDVEIEDISICNIATDVSNINDETLFVFIRSINFDVSKIINDVIKKSPAAIICDEEFEISTTSIPIIRVKNTRTALPYLFSRFYNIDFGKIRFVAITGTNGKTSTATMLTHILKYVGKNVGFIGTGKIEINGIRITDSKYSMTTPDPNLLYSSINKMEKAGCEFVIMEVSSHSLFFDKVKPIPYEIAIFTNLTPEHTDFHKTMEDYFLTKLKIFKQSKLGILNMDDAYCRRAADLCECEKISIGVLHSSDVTASDIKLNGIHGSEYIYKEKNRLFKVKLKLGGAFNVYNSMMALTAAIKLNVNPIAAKEAMASLSLIDGRLEIIDNDVTVIIDYAHTPESLKNILKTINSSKKHGQKLNVVFGCGGDRDRKKRPIMARIAEENSDFVIVTSDNSRGESENKIIKEVLSGFTGNAKRIVITSRKSAIFHAILSSKKGDIVAIVGKGHERYNIDKSGVHDFDERSIIEEALKRRKEKYHENYSESNSDA